MIRYRLTVVAAVALALIWAGVLAALADGAGEAIMALERVPTSGIF